MLKWSELWRYAKATGRTPAEAARDPDLAFNISVMRAHEALRQFKWSLLHNQIGAKDEFGIGHIVNTLKLIYEDS